MAIPFAVVLAATALTTRRRILWMLAACLMFSGALITQRKSGVVVPAVALLALFVMRPRQLMRLAPFGVVALAIGLVLSGGSFSSVHLLQTAGGNESTIGRTSDYSAVVPDLLSNPLLGRGYGTLDPARIDTYRIFDNEYLGELYQVGTIGLFAFIALILTPLLLVRSVLQSENPLRGPPALAAGAGCLAFAVAACLYDILSFAEAPYLFLFLAGMCICAGTVEVPSPRARAAANRPRPAIGPVPVPARS
jgi:O-antigen ligase